jgi:hypothetical protein
VEPAVLGHEAGHVEGDPLGEGGGRDRGGPRVAIGPQLGLEPNGRQHRPGPTAGQQHGVEGAAAVGAERGGHDVERRRAEAVGRGQVAEPVEHGLGRARRRAPGRDVELDRGLLGDAPVVVEQRDGERAGDAPGGVVDDVEVPAVQPLVGGEEGDRAARASHGPERRLGPA